MARQRIWQVERWLGDQPQPLPYRFARAGKRRIISWPTLYGWVLLFVLLLAGMTALNYNNGSAIAMVLFLISMYVWGLVFSQNPLLAIELLSVNAPDSSAGNAGQLLLTVRNTSKNDSLFQTVVAQTSNSCTVHAKQLERLTLVTTGWRRGCHPLPRLRFVSLWPFGICRSIGYFLPNGSFWVTPALLENGLPMPGGQAPQQASGMAQQGEHVHHLRAYQRGDAMRDIAWKASARTDSLLSRTYEQPKKGHCHIEWTAWEHLPLETRLSQFATWLTQAEQLQWSSLLDTPRGRVGPGFGEAHLQQALRLLAGWPEDKP